MHDFVVFLLLLLEAFVTLAYPVLFYKLINRIETPHYQLVIYCSLMVIVLFTRYIYYITETGANRINPNVKDIEIIHVLQLIPSVVAESLLSLLFFYHLWQINHMQEKESNITYSVALNSSIRMSSSLRFSGDPTKQFVR